MKRHEIQVLRRAGMSIRKIAELAGVSESSVKRIVREPAIEQAGPESQAALRGVGRPSKTEDSRSFIAEVLTEEPDLPTVELLQRRTPENEQMPQLHQLRHKRITELLLSDVPAVRVQRWAGHADLRTTQGYVHLDDEGPNPTTTATRCDALATRRSATLGNPKVIPFPGKRCN